MTLATNGHTSVSVIAGPITPSTRRPDTIVYMGDGLSILYTPETARQWIGVLETIATKEDN